MISGFFERGRFAQVLRAARSLLGGAAEAESPPPREPYVQGVTASSAIICWVSESPDAGVVEYGETFEPGHKEADARVGRRHAVREDLEPLFVKHGVDLVFGGHDHVYERTVPIRGVTYVVSGGGGRRLYRAGKSAFTASSKPAHHAVIVRVGGGRFSLEAVEPSGTVLDRLELYQPYVK